MTFGVAYGAASEVYFGYWARGQGQDSRGQGQDTLEVGVVTGARYPRG